MTATEGINKLINYYISQIGYIEGANNWNKYAENKDIIKWYGWKPQSQPWCDTWVDNGFDVCFGLDLAAQMTYQPIGAGSALCSQSAQYYKNNNAWYTTNPQRGDQIFFYYDGNINHTGIVEKVVGNVVYTIEGNTSDMVARRSYLLLSDSRIAGFGRPNYKLLENNSTSTSPTNPTNPVSPTPTNKSIYPLLKKGSPKKIAVRAIQTLLIAQGFKCGGYGVDGDFGFGTYESVKDIQREANLTVDGEVGNYTWCYLITGLKDGSNPSILKKGCPISKSVKSAQQLLIKLGFNCGGYGDDGDFGNGTENSVKEYKKKVMYIKNPTGEIDLNMWKSLIGG